MSKLIHLRMSRASISKAVEEVKAYQKKMEDGINRIVEEMAREGVTISQVKFASAQYDGTNDVTVTQFSDGKGKAIVHADGQSVLFIEFGTGVTYPDNHPEASTNGMIRGEYGYHLGRLPGGWRYYGDPGTNGEVITEGKHAGMVHTYGNPANMSMYQTVRDLEAKFTDIVRRVFSV